MTDRALIMFAILHWSCASGGNKQREKIAFFGKKNSIPGYPSPFIIPFIPCVSLNLLLIFKITLPGKMIHLPLVDLKQTLVRTSRELTVTWDLQPWPAASSQVPAPQQKKNAFIGRKRKLGWLKSSWLFIGWVLIRKERPSSCRALLSSQCVKAPSSGRLTLLMFLFIFYTEFVGLFHA